MAQLRPYWGFLPKAFSSTTSMTRRSSRCLSLWWRWVTSPRRGAEKARMLEVILAGGSGGLGSVCARSLESAFRLIISYKSNEKRARTLAGIATVVKADLAVAKDRARLLDTASKLYGLVVFSGDPARGLPE